MNIEQKHRIGGRSMEQVDGIFEQIMVKKWLENSESMHQRNLSISK